MTRGNYTCYGENLQPDSAALEITAITTQQPVVIRTTLKQPEETAAAANGPTSCRFLVSVIFVSSAAIFPAIAIVALCVMMAKNQRNKRCVADEIELQPLAPGPDQDIQERRSPELQGQKEQQQIQEQERQPQAQQQPGQPQIQEHECQVSVQKSDVSEQKTDVPVQKTDVPVQKTDVLVQKTDVQVQKSDVSERKPDVSVQKPDVHVQESDVSEQKPDVSMQKPQVHGQKPFQIEQDIAASAQPDTDHKFCCAFLSKQPEDLQELEHGNTKLESMKIKNTEANEWQETECRHRSDSKHLEDELNFKQQYFVDNDEEFELSKKQAIRSLATMQKHEKELFELRKYQENQAFDLYVRGRSELQILVEKRNATSVSNSKGYIKKQIDYLKLGYHYSKCRMRLTARQENEVLKAQQKHECNDQLCRKEAENGLSLTLNDYENNLVYLKAEHEMEIETIFNRQRGELE